MAKATDLPFAWRIWRTIPSRCPRNSIRVRHIRGWGKRYLGVALQDHLARSRQAGAFLALNQPTNQPTSQPSNHPTFQPSNHTTMQNLTGRIRHECPMGQLYQTSALLKDLRHEKTDIEIVHPEPEAGLRLGFANCLWLKTNGIILG